MDKLHIDAILAITRLSFGLDKLFVKTPLIQLGCDKKFTQSQLCLQPNPVIVSI
jgi:hypothetical protein